MSDKDTKALTVPEVLPPAVQKQVNNYKEQGCHILLPVVTTNRPDITYALEIIQVSANPEDKQIYRMSFWKPGEFAFTKQTLLRFAMAAGITWKPNRRLDNYGNRDYVCMQVTACMTKPDGTQMEFPATKEVDLLLEEEKLRHQYKKNGKTPEEGEPLVRRDMLQLRTHKLSLCETKAMLRAIRGLLGLPSTVKQQALRKPFVIPRLDLFHSQPVQAQHIQAQQGVNDLFGNVPLIANAVPDEESTPKAGEKTTETRTPAGDNLSDGGPLPGEETFEFHKKALEDAATRGKLKFAWKQIAEDDSITKDQGLELGKIFGKQKKIFEKEAANET